MGDYEKALEYYQQALALSQAVSDRSGEASTLINVGAVYFALGKKEKASEYYQQALPIVKAVGDRSGEAITLGWLGIVHHDQGELDEAIKYLERSEELLVQVRSPDLQVVRQFLAQWRAERGN